MFVRQFNMDQDFNVHLFSNSCLNRYANTLTKFTTDLAHPIYLRGKFSVALSEISLPASYPFDATLAARDAIIFEEYKYAPNKTVEDFIDIALRLSSADIRFYDRNYFKEFLDDSILYSPDTLSQVHPDCAKNFPTSIKKTLYFNLSLASLLYDGDSKLYISLVLPPGDDAGVASTYLMNSYVMLAPRQRYTLKQILYFSIEKILEKTRIEAMQPLPRKSPTEEDPKRVEYVTNQNFLSMAKKYTTKESFEKALLTAVQMSQKLIRAFIDHFIATVLNIRNKIMLERGLSAIRLEKFLIVYTDIIDEQFFADTKSRVLGIYPFDSSKELSIKVPQLDYVRVNNQIIHSISIALMDENGVEINLQPSQTPSHVGLKFRKDYD